MTNSFFHCNARGALENSDILSEEGKGSLIRKVETTRRIEREKRSHNSRCKNTNELELTYRLDLTNLVLSLDL
jgi:hypothetical protein